MTAFVTRTTGDVVSEILMSRNASTGSLLLLEGDDDVRFWKTRATSRGKCQFVLAGSKTTVIGAVIRANELGQSGILGIVDDDYDSLLNNAIPSRNVIRTECRDMETVMLSGPALKKVLGELGNPGKIRSLEQHEGRDIVDAFRSRAELFGQLRFLNALNGWSISFDQLRPYRFADMTSWSFDRGSILREAVRQVPGLTIQELEEQLGRVPVKAPWSILHGKDSIKVLAVGLRATIGETQCSESRIMQMLRLAFDQSLFQATTLRARVSEWEADNQPYRILPPE